jgi:hypothetical protein
VSTPAEKLVTLAGIDCPQAGASVREQFTVCGSLRNKRKPPEHVYLCLVMVDGGGNRTVLGGPYTDPSSPWQYTVSTDFRGTGTLYAYWVVGTTPPDCMTVHCLEDVEYTSVANVTVDPNATPTNCTCPET